MTHIRLPLRRQLWEAWKQTIREDYDKQLINSENGLQACLMNHLKRSFEDFPKKRRIFIEPRVFNSGPQKRRWYPDLVICNEKEVIAVFELKYYPRGFVKWEKDLRKLNRISQLKSELYVSNTRYRGKPVDNHKYTFSPTTLFGWLGVHRPFPHEPNPRVPILSEGHQFLSNRFVQLHALTRRDKPPKLVRRLG